MESGHTAMWYVTVDVYGSFTVLIERQHCRVRANVTPVVFHVKCSDVRAKLRDVGVL